MNLENKAHWKKIKKEITGELKNNRSKQDVYEHYVGKVDDATLRRFLAAKPDPDLKRNYKIINKLIVWMWILLFCVRILRIHNGFPGNV